MSEHYNLDEAVRKVPNYPKEGIVFYDITGILTNPRAFGFCVDRMVEIYRERKIGAVAAIESRGFIFAAPLAARLSIPLILVRKAGKLPGAVYRENYHLEYGAAAVEIHESDVPQDREVLLIDDLIATGGTLHASRRILRARRSPGQSRVRRYRPAISPLPRKTAGHQNHHSHRILRGKALSTPKRSV